MRCAGSPIYTRRTDRRKSDHERIHDMLARMLICRIVTNTRSPKVGTKLGRPGDILPRYIFKNLIGMERERERERERRTVQYSIESVRVPILLGSVRESEPTTNNVSDERSMKKQQTLLGYRLITNDNNRPSNRLYISAKIYTHGQKD